MQPYHEIVWTNHTICNKCDSFVGHDTVCKHQNSVISLGRLLYCFFFEKYISWFFFIFLILLIRPSYTLSLLKACCNLTSYAKSDDEREKWGEIKGNG